MGCTIMGPLGPHLFSQTPLQIKLFNVLEPIQFSLFQMQLLPFVQARFQRKGTADKAPESSCLVQQRKSWKFSDFTHVLLLQKIWQFHLPSSKTQSHRRGSPDFLFHGSAQTRPQGTFVKYGFQRKRLGDEASDILVPCSMRLVQ